MMMSNQDIELIKRARSFALALNIQDTGLQNFLASLVPSSSPSPSPSSPPPSPPYSEGISKLSSSAQGRCLGAGEDVSANRVKASGDVSANRVKASGDVSANRVKASGDVLSSSAQGRCLGAGEDVSANRVKASGDVSANRVKASGDVLSSSAQGRCLGAGEDVDTLSPIAQGRCLGARGGDVDTLTLIPPPDTLSPYLDVSTDELLKKASVIAELASNSQILPPKTYSQLLQDQKSQQIAARTPSLAKPIGQALAESQGAPPSMGTAPGSLTPTSSDRGPSNMSQGVGHGVTATTTGSGLSSRPARSHISQGQAHRPSKKASSLQLKEGRSFTPLDDELCIQLNRILARNDITQDRTSSSNSWDDTHGPFYPHFAPSKRASLGTYPFFFYKKEKDNNSFNYIDDKNREDAIQLNTIFSNPYQRRREREEDRGYVSPTYEKSSHYPGCHGAKGGSGDTDARLNYHGGKGNGFSAVSFSGGRGRGKGKKGGKGSVGGSVVSSQASVPGGVQVARAKRAEASGGLDYSKGELPWVSGGGSVSHYSSTYSRAPHSMPPLHVEPSTLVSHIKKLAQANYMTPGTGGHGGSLGDPNYLIGATGGKGSSFSQSSSRTPSHNRLLAILKNITHTGGGKGPAGTVNGTYATTM